MLVLTRKAGESVMIGSDIVVTVLEARGEQIRIGISAPRSVKVHREEIYRQVEQDNSAAIASAGRASALLGTRAPNLVRREPDEPRRERTDDED